MSRILKISCTALVLIIIMAVVSFAGTDEATVVIPSYFTQMQTKPGDCVPNSPWTPAAGMGTINIALNQMLWVGADNQLVEWKTKYIVVTLWGTNLDKLNNTSAKATGYRTCNDSSNVAEFTGAIAVNLAKTRADFNFEFKPQPDWELMKFVAQGGAATVDSIRVDSNCPPVPTLTQYGLGVLVLLLIATAFVVYRRRHRVIA